MLPDDARLCILLADPFTTSTESVLQKFNRARSGVPVIGGVASWAMSPGRNRLVSDHGVTDSGFVGVVLRGSLEVDVVVSQGCRPVGETFTVTACQGNVISELDHELPLQILEQVFADADQEDQNLMRSGILVGRGVSLDREALGRGSFLVRGVIGADRDSGSISVADHMNQGEIVQFHVRDAMTAKDDLEMLLIPQAFEDKPSGVVLFTCNGRGERFFGHPNVDVTTVGRALGDDVPVAGFFCGGEIGPIGNSNFIHGYTASMAIFRPG
jgi:small ligand-binding sensory domain FIST